MKHNKPREKYILSWHKTAITLEDVRKSICGNNRVIWNFALPEQKRIEQFLHAIMECYPNKFCEKEIIEWGNLLLHYNPFTYEECLTHIQNFIYR